MRVERGWGLSAFKESRYRKSFSLGYLAEVLSDAPERASERNRVARAFG